MQESYALSTSQRAPSTRFLVKLGRKHKYETAESPVGSVVVYGFMIDTDVGRAQRNVTRSRPGRDCNLRVISRVTTNYYVGLAFRCATNAYSVPASDADARRDGRRFASRRRQLQDRLRSETDVRSVLPTTTA